VSAKEYSCADPLSYQLASSEGSAHRCQRDDNEEATQQSDAGTRYRELSLHCWLSPLDSTEAAVA
jgi:hypothetical protein